MGKFSIRDMMAPTEEPQETSIAPAVPEVRTIDTITAEINFYKRQTAQNIIEIGRRLIEAKEQLAHGEWLPWLRDRVEIKDRMAQRFMQIARDFSNTSPVTHLNYTQVLALLQVPADERETFLAESHLVDGEEKTVAEMSKRQLEQAIRERDIAKREAEASTKIAKEFERKAKREYDNYMTALVKIEKMEESERALEGHRQVRIRSLERQLKELESRPIDVAVQETSPAQVERMRQEIRKELEREMSGGLALPPDTLVYAQAAFSSTIQNAFDSFRMIVEVSAVEQIPPVMEDCVSICEQVRDRLLALRDRARNVMYQGGRDLPPEEDDDDND